MHRLATSSRSLVSVAGSLIAGALLVVSVSASSASTSPPKLSGARTFKAPTKCPSAAEVGAALGAKEPNPTSKTLPDYIKCTYGTSALANFVEMYGANLKSFEAGEKLSAVLKPKSISGLGEKAYAVGPNLIVLDNGLLFEVSSITASLTAEEKLVRKLIASL